MKQISLIRTLVLSTLTLTACGPQAFTPALIESNQTAAGGVDLPPRVDIVVGVSSDGGMQNIRNSLQSQLNTFVQKLESQKWDYRLVFVSMSEYDNAYINSQYYNHDHTVAASRYDSNHGSNWIAPYPGASLSDPFYKINSLFFNTGIVLPSINSAHIDGHQFGLRNQANFINLAAVKTNILRPDATLAVITISNGRDASDGWTTQSSSVGYSNGVTSSGTQTVPNAVNVTNYVQQMQSVKMAPSMLKYYSIVSEHSSTNCLYGPARRGEEYIQASNMTDGLAIDLCNRSIGSALDAIASDIQSQPLYFVKEYLVMNSEPNLSTVKVFKNGQLLPQSSTNGWTYEGYSPSKALITLPIPMDYRTGYIIKLNGTAKLVGSDTATVEYLGNGVQTAH
jgi:hypothetical protein